LSLPVYLDSKKKYKSGKWHRIYSQGKKSLAFGFKRFYNEGAIIM
jgi:hypothetical protein